MARGAKLAVGADRKADFEALGHTVTYDAEEALERATVVVDCTPAGNRNKAEIYENLSGPKGFLAQGSEFDFGKPYARGVNDQTLVPGEDRYLQVVSCNTHNITTLVKTLAFDPDGRSELERGTFVCMRRANDVTQADGFIPAPSVGKHDDPEFGTHHARDANHLFQTMDLDLNLFSSAVKLNTQYMHSLWFNIVLNRGTSLDEVLRRLRENHRVAMTDKRTANLIFSFGRDHGYYGRILSQTVMVEPTLQVRRDREIYGFCFTAAGRELPALFGGRDPLVDRSGSRQRRSAPRPDPTVGLPGNLTTSLRFGDLSLEGSSRAGVATWFRVHPPGLAFDVGRGSPVLTGAKDVFLTHGHLDHALGLPMVLSFRSSAGRSTRVFCPRDVVDGVRNFVDAASRLEERTYDWRLEGLAPGRRVEVGPDLTVEAFSSDHVVPSLGYHLLRRKRRLRPELVGLPGQELGRRRRDGEDIEVETEEILLSYSGDTGPSLFESEPRLFQARVLLLECTFLGPGRRESAGAFGHLHVDDVVAVAERFEGEALVLHHLSRRYDEGELLREVLERAPCLNDRLFVVTE